MVVGTMPLVRSLVSEPWGRLPVMKLSKDLVQHIAVFGESGSGKTVMLSSFYGAAQEPQFLKTSLFRVVAENVGQGTRLHKNYLGMRDSAQVPEGTRFAPTSYSFAIRLKDGAAKAQKNKQFDGLRLVWHDYPGGWFEDEVSGPEEAQRKVETFRSLLVSDIALLLVDGQRLMDNAGEEERYLKSLFSNFRNGLFSLKDDLLTDGKPLTEFPRIWMVALTKADLLPDLDVYKFRDLIIGKAGDDLTALRDVIAGLVVSNDALAVGEDFLRLSSAKFEPGNIEVTERVGLDLILPVAAIFPFEKYVKWVREKRVAADVAASLLESAGPLAAEILGKAISLADKLPGPVGKVVKLIGAALTEEALIDAAKLAAEALRKRHADAVSSRDNLAATLTGFKMDLEKGEEDRVLFRGA